MDSIEDLEAMLDSAVAQCNTDLEDEIVIKRKKLIEDMEF